MAPRRNTNDMIDMQAKKDHAVISYLYKSLAKVTSHKAITMNWRRMKAANSHRTSLLTLTHPWRDPCQL
jgi:hypothetical protein